MSLLSLKNKSAEELVALLNKDKLKCVNAIEKTILYNYYVDSLKDVMNAHNAQAVHYMKFKKHIQDEIDTHQIENSSIYENILGLKHSGLVVRDYTADTYNSYRNQPLNSIDDTTKTANPYGWWGYDANSEKWFCKLPFVYADGYESGWLVNSSYLNGFKIVIKDANEPYVYSAGDIVISEADNVETTQITTGSTNTIKLYVDDRVMMTFIIKGVFEKEGKLKNEAIYLMGEGTYQTSWGGSLTLPSHLE